MQAQSTKLTKEEQKVKALEAIKAKERIFNLVVKIISWKTESKDSSSMQTQNKITAEEWQRYKKHLLDISKTEGVEVVKGKLKEVYLAIKKHNGFED